MRIIFLDIDGVLNHRNTRSTLLMSETEPLPLPIAPECLTRLNRLVTETGAKIVISSSWRLYAPWKDLGQALSRRGLVADVLGGTPDLVNDAVWKAHWLICKGVPFAYDKLERGWEIREWLAAHPEVTAFVILDDCSDMGTLGPWLVLTHRNSGLEDPDVIRAARLLEQQPMSMEGAVTGALGTRDSPLLHEQNFVTQGRAMPHDNTDGHDLEIIPPHALPNQLRACYRGTLTMEEAQTKLGNAYRVLELCPAQCLSDDPTSNQLVAATEVIFART